MFDILLRIFNYFGITGNSPTPSNQTLPQPPAPSGPITSLGKKPPKIPPKKDNIVK